MVNKTALRIALLRKGLAQWQLAKKLGYQPATFSDYIRAARRPPENLEARIEKALGLPAGALNQ